MECDLSLAQLIGLIDLMDEKEMLHNTKKKIV